MLLTLFSVTFILCCSPLFLKQWEDICLIPTWKRFIYLLSCVCMCFCECMLCVWVLSGATKGIGSPGAGFWMQQVVCHLMWVLGNELRPSGRTANLLPPSHPSNWCWFSLKNVCGISPGCSLLFHSPTHAHWLNSCSFLETQNKYFLLCKAFIIEVARNNLFRVVCLSVLKFLPCITFCYVGIEGAMWW